MTNAFQLTFRYLEMVRPCHQPISPFLLLMNHLDVRANSDATLPCTPCTRSHAHAVKLYPNTAPAQPECAYDKPDEVAEGPRGKISRLEAQIGM